MLKWSNHIFENVTKNKKNIININRKMLRIETTNSKHLILFEIIWYKIN